jgi:hypothetical protein
MSDVVPIEQFEQVILLMREALDSDILKLVYRARHRQRALVDRVLAE